jgi:Ca2+-transporting ATPase
LGFAYQIIEDNQKGIENGKLVADDLTFMGIVGIEDPIR